MKFIVFKSECKKKKIIQIHKTWTEWLKAEAPKPAILKGCLVHRSKSLKTRISIVRKTKSIIT